MLVYIYPILVLLLLLVFTVFVLLHISGLFEKIVIHQKVPPSCLSCGPMFAYKIHEGPHDQVGYLFTETYSVNPHLIQCSVHFENADSMSPPEPKSAVGALLNEGDQNCQEAFELAGFRLTRLPPVNEALVTSFPHTTVLSITLGSHRVYRQLRSYIEDNDLQVNGFVELYDGQWIHYIGLLKDEDEFRKAIFPTTLSESDAATASKAMDMESDAVGEGPIETLECLQDTQPSPLLVPSGDGKIDGNTGNNGNGDIDEIEASFEKIIGTSELDASQ